MADKFCHRCTFRIGCAGSDGVGECKGFVEAAEEEWTKVVEKGSKATDGKMGWYAMPLEMIEPLADVFNAGVHHYGLFNILGQFENPNEDFYNATMRHLKSCQMDPLAIDPQDGKYEAAKVAFNILARLYHCGRKP